MCDEAQQQQQQLELLIDLHSTTERQGPGGEEQTKLAIALSGFTSSTATAKPTTGSSGASQQYNSASSSLQIADIGCGTGAASLVLAKELQDAHVTAVDVVPSFLETLQQRASKAGLANKVKVVQSSMTDLSNMFEKGQLDAIWSEGAIYNIGFEQGIREWRKFLKPNSGVLAVSDLTWLTSSNERPPRVDSYWRTEYDQIDTASAKIALLENHGYKLLGYFALPYTCWMDNYYRPIPFDDFLERHAHSQAARELVHAERDEIQMYETFHDYYSYGYYVAQRVDLA